MNLNPCEWKWFWPLIEWMSDDCQCCAIVRALVLGAALGLLFGAPWRWQLDALLGVVLLGVAIAATMLRTPPKDEEPPQ